MKNSLYFGMFLITFSILTFTSCKDDEPTDATFNMNVSGLEDLGDNFRYEGWLIVDGSPVTAGIFSVDANGQMSTSTFTVSESDLSSASTYVLTIEPFPDSDPSPSDVHVLAGDFSGNSASLTVNHGAALGTNFSGASGGYILATPTDGEMNNENSGVWFLDPGAGPGAALNLPTLPTGWAYEGWAVINGTPVSTGTFTSVTGADNSAPFSGTMGGPPFPGEDFLMNAPSGLSFPTDLSEGAIVISVEPVPDNSPAPFAIKPLMGAVPAGAADHTFYNMGNISGDTNPTGTVTR